MVFLIQLTATINTPYFTEYTQVKYVNWTPTFPPSPVFIPTDMPTAIYRKYSRLCLDNTSVIRMRRQVQRQFIRTIMRQQTYTINHDININQLRKVCQVVRSRIMSGPQLCITVIYPQNPGEDPIITQVTTIIEQIQATKSTYGRQMAPPPGMALFYGTISHDATVPAGITTHPNRYFNDVYLPKYHSLHSMFDTYTKHRVIQVHRRLMYLSKSVPSHNTLQ